MPANVARSSRKGPIAVSSAEGCGFEWAGVAAPRAGVGGDWRGRVCRPPRCFDFACLPLHTSALPSARFFCARRVSYGLIVVCVLFHDYYSPRSIHPGLRIFHNLSAMLCFAFVVYVIQRYMEQREALAKTVQQQRDDLLKDRRAGRAGPADVSSRWANRPLPDSKSPGMMHAAKGVGGDYYDYIPIDAHTIQIVDCRRSREKVLLPPS